MRSVATRLSFVMCLIGSTSRSAAEPPVLVACDELPAAVAALGPRSDIQAFAVAPEASVAIASQPSPGDASRSVIRFTHGEDPPRDVKLAGRLLGLAVAADGKVAYAIVRVTDRKGGVRTVDLLRLDLASGRASIGASLPVTARGLALGSAGSVLWVASRDEIRTFQLPGLASGPLYKAIGENVGVAPLAGSSAVYLAQPSRVVLADLAASQDRDGLTLSEEVAAPAPLTGMLSSTGEVGPIALSDGGGSFCIRNGALPPPPPRVEDPAAAPPRENAAPVAPAPTDAPPVVAPVAPAPTDAPPVVAPVAPAPTDAPPVVAPVAAPDDADKPPAAPVAAPDDADKPPAAPAAAPENLDVPPVAAAAVPAEPGTVSGTISGPSIAMVEAIVLLGPDNILHEATRAAPDDQGRFAFHALPPGSYRIVAAGKGGRVLMCDPPFITIRVSSSGAVEAPVLNVLRAQ